MSLDLWKELIPDLLQKKNGVLNDDNEKEYSPYLVNQALSYHLDCIIHANELNINYNLDKKMQYDYYFHALRAWKRPYQPWLKTTKNDDLETIKAFFKLTDGKAREILPLINKEQLDLIKQKLTVGGK